jgi:hypothetical protein
MRRVSEQTLHELPDGTVILTPNEYAQHGQFSVKAASSFDGTHYRFTVVGIAMSTTAMYNAEIGFNQTSIELTVKRGMREFYVVSDEEVLGFLDWFTPRFAQSLKSHQTRLPDGAIHVDEWLDRQPVYHGEEKILGYVHFVLHHFRTSSTWQMAHREALKEHRLFVDYEGKRYRVTGASRMGDLLLQSDLSKDHGYDIRVGLDFKKLTNWSKEP